MSSYKKWICTEYNTVKDENSDDDVLLNERFTELLIVQKNKPRKEKEDNITSQEESCKCAKKKQGICKHNCGPVFQP